MLKLIILLSFIFCSFSNFFAQNFGNEWINYSQKYYKIPISTNGVYRINKQALVSSEIPIDAIDPRNIQIFHKGKEIPIYITTGQYLYLFENNDYIEFVQLVFVKS